MSSLFVGIGTPTPAVMYGASLWSSCAVGGTAAAVDDYPVAAHACVLSSTVPRLRMKERSSTPVVQTRVELSLAAPLTVY
ncbi:MAG: hypothetical protein GY696_02045 [Gammaproteobacteria bacterium]|nr:hypothetical protein [Gammaproteobacteria bacterium]